MVLTPYAKPGHILADGKRFGRPRIPIYIERGIIKCCREGKAILKIAVEVSVGGGTVRRVLRDSIQR